MWTRSLGPMLNGPGVRTGIYAGGYRAKLVLRLQRTKQELEQSNFEEKLVSNANSAVRPSKASVQSKQHYSAKAELSTMKGKESVPTIALIAGA